MESNEYIKNAIRTESVPTSIQIDQTVMHGVLELSIATSHIVDAVKRQIFYGKAPDSDKLIEQIATAYQMAAFLGHAVDSKADILTPKSQEELDNYKLPAEIAGIKLGHINIRLLHAAFGMFTESGELIELIKAQYETGVMDKVGFGEETGDVEWYQAIAYDETGVSEASIREKNIAKLKARYPEKFDAGQAVNRDLNAERKILEAGGCAGTVVVDTTPAIGAAANKPEDDGIITKGQ